MAKKSPDTDRSLLLQARGQLFTDANRFETHGLPHAQTDKLVARIDTHLLKTKEG